MFDIYLDNGMNSIKMKMYYFFKNGITKIFYFIYKEKDKKIRNILII
jgi:hypothetical protein